MLSKVYKFIFRELDLEIKISSRVYQDEPHFDKTLNELLENAVRLNQAPNPARSVAENLQ